MFVPRFTERADMGDAIDGKIYMLLLGMELATPSAQQS